MALVKVLFLFTFIGTISRIEATGRTNQNPVHLGSEILIQDSNGRFRSLGPNEVHLAAEANIGLPGVRSLHDMPTLKPGEGRDIPFKQSDIVNSVGTSGVNGASSQHISVVSLQGGNPYNLNGQHGLSNSNINTMINIPQTSVRVVEMPSNHRQSDDILGYQQGNNYDYGKYVKNAGRKEGYGYGPEFSYRIADNNAGKGSFPSLGADVGGSGNFDSGPGPIKLTNSLGHQNFNPEMPPFEGGFMGQSGGPNVNQDVPPLDGGFSGPVPPSAGMNTGFGFGPWANGPAGEGWNQDGPSGFGPEGPGPQGPGAQGFGPQGWGPNDFGPDGFGPDGMNQQGWGQAGFGQGWNQQGWGQEGPFQGMGQAGWGDQGLGQQGWGQQGWGQDLNQQFGNTNFPAGGNLPNLANLNSPENFQSRFLPNGGAGVVLPNNGAAGPVIEQTPDAVDTIQPILPVNKGPGPVPLNQAKSSKTF